MSITTANATALPTGTWTLDAVHSSIGFEVDYMVGAFRGHFADVDAELTVDDGSARLTGAARVASVQVKDENLEAHLQSPDFFDAERHPELQFEAEDIARSGDQVAIRGEITIKGVTKPIELIGTITAPVTDAYGRERLGLRLGATVDRTDFGVDWNVPLPDGKPALADEVKLTAELFFVQEA
jgi:polyisoprenoid-binding protein YceI